MTNQLNQGSKNNKTNPLLKIIFGVVGVFVIICGLITLNVFYKFGRSYFEPKTQIIIEPDFSVVPTQVDPSVLFAAVDILNARCRSLECGFSFTISENNQIVAQVPNSIDPQNFLEQVLKVGILELVDLGESPIPTGSTIATDFGMTGSPQLEGQIWHTVMTGTAFKSANVTQDQFGKYQIEFTLNSNGTKLLSDFSSNNIGHYLGIVMDKIVISAPMISTHIPDGKGVIQGNFTQESAESLAMYITMGALPIPLKVK
jgi:preprotein translocase subunit SecD